MNNNNNNNNNNNSNSNKSKSFALKEARTLEDMDAMYDRLSEGLDLAAKNGVKECAVCKTIADQDLPSCETCGKPRTDYKADAVLSNEELSKGFDRLCEWADKKKKEGKK